MRTDRRRATLLLASLCAAAGATAQTRAGFDLAALTALLGQVKSGEASFVETRRVEMLDRTLESSGRLSFRSPDVFVRETLKPRPERLEVAGNTVTMTRGGQSRTVQLDSVPEAAVVVEAVRGTLTGDRAALEKMFDASVSGNADDWTLGLAPRDARLRRQVQSLELRGRGAAVREVRILLADGDRSTMTISPAGR